MIELENKYKISKACFMSLINYGIDTGNHSIKFIKQYYLFKENASIHYNKTEHYFSISLLYGNDEKTSIKVYVDSINEREKILSLLGDVNDSDNLLEAKGTYRIRFMNGSPIFTMKKKEKGVAGTFEFEYCLKRLFNNSSNAHFFDILNDIQSCIVKIRHIIKMDNNLVYELDDYQDFSFYTLEVEFPNEESQNNFVPNFDYISDETDNSEMKNKNMAKSLIK